MYFTQRTVFPLRPSLFSTQERKVHCQEGQVGCTVKKPEEGKGNRGQKVKENRWQRVENLVLRNW